MLQRICRTPGSGCAHWIYPGDCQRIESGGRTRRACRQRNGRPMTWKRINVFFKGLPSRFFFANTSPPSPSQPQKHVHHQHDDRRASWAGGGENTIKQNYQRAFMAFMDTSTPKKHAAFAGKARTIAGPKPLNMAAMPSFATKSLRNHG
jgi:hypothetical protein